MVTCRARGRRAAPTRPCRLLGGVVALGGVSGLGSVTLRSLEVRSDRLGLCATAARTTATLLVATIAGCLGAALRAVRHGAFLPFLGLVADRSLATRFGDRVGNGLRDQLDGTD